MAKKKKKKSKAKSKPSLPDFSQIETKWQKKWDAARVFEADKNSRKKFFTSVVIPYPSGDPHIGHARTYTRTDIMARFKRMQGYNVLNPVGFHATGNRALVLIKRIKEGDKQTINTLKNIYNCTEKDIKKLTTPEKLVNFFIKRAIKTFKKAGLAIDWRRVFSSIDKEFSQLITWQFKTLRRKGYVIKDSHPVIYCPSCDSPITQSDRAEGEEARIDELYIYKCPLESGVILPAATLRPETIYAWTNMFINPDAEYVIAKVGDEKWVVSRAAARRLKRQRDDVLVIDEIVADELIGKKCKNPATGDWMLVLPASFIDADIATGIVASEPSDAPDDHIALEELKNKPKLLKRYGLKPQDIDAIRYKELIKVPKYGTKSAIKICEELGITSLDQKDKLLEAKKKAYKLQYHEGKLTKLAGKLAGKSIPDAIKAVAKTLSDDIEMMYQPSEPVVCKCGADCYIKILKDQWFLKYGDEKWKGKVKKYLKKIGIRPEFWRPKFDAALDWTQNKACARRSGLGTPLPFDDEWTIETLSDSTIYMSYYIISKYINDKKLKAKNMNRAFFDYILLGKGGLKTAAKKTRLKKSLLKKVRADFKYWYPMDWRNSGKDLVSNHLLYYLYNHIAIFPRSNWPGDISVNGFVKLSGEKMSKSKGRAVTFKTGIQKYGADIVRAVTTTTASPEQDCDFRHEDAENMINWRNKFYNTVLDISRTRTSRKKMKNLDKWLRSRMTNVIKTATENLEVLNTREAAQACFYKVASDFKWYVRRSGGRVSKTAKKAASDWVKLVSVFMPHTCEELWSKLGNKGFVAEASWPKSDMRRVSEKAEKSERAVQKVVKDIYHITRITDSTPKKIYIYVIPPELALYKEAKEFLSEEFDADVQVYASNDKSKHDPQNKAKKAKPGKPGIYLE